jgi:hypothetical protein
MDLNENLPEFGRQTRSPLGVDGCLVDSPEHSPLHALPRFTTIYHSVPKTIPATPWVVKANIDIAKRIVLFLFQRLTALTETRGNRTVSMVDHWRSKVTGNIIEESSGRHEDIRLTGERR